MSKSKDYIFVTIQFLLFVAFYFDISIMNFFVPNWIQVLTLILAIFGVVIVLLAILQLNKNLSPFPSPKSGSQLIKTGLYKFIRHPIYTGIILTFLGFSIYSESIYRLIITAILYFLFLLKSGYEEKLLQKKFSEYEEYRSKTGRFFPKI